jgi:penicillin amidase
MADDPLAALRDQAAEALFPTEGTLRADGLAAPVTITRGPFGMPVIEAASTDDLWFAHGMLTAGERLFQLDMALRAANGRLSELFGPLTLDDDRFIRTVGLHLAGARMVGEDWDDQDHAMHARFRGGVRAWLAQAPAPPVEYRMLGAAPKLPDDPAAWASCFAYLAWGLSNNLETELLRARIRAEAGEEAMRTLVPPTSGRRGTGSNAWVLAGSRTSSGAPLLANDPHLLALQPGPWMPVHLRAPGYDVRGVALTFAPGVVLGATPHHAWGATNVTGDVQDLFVVTDDDVTGVRTESIVVLGERDPVEVHVRETTHGPIVDRVPVGDTGSVHESVPGTFALRWTGREVGLRPSTLVRAARATSFEDFAATVLEVRCPGQNWMYADAEGHIGVQVTGAHPVRGIGDGSVPLPDHDWRGWIPDDAMPRIADPGDGVLVTANDGLLTAGRTGGHLLTTDFHEPNRALRIRELLDDTARHDVVSAGRIQRDTVSLAARRLTPLLIARVPGARDHLDGWDHDLAADSRPAAVFQAWVEAIAERALGPHLPAPAIAAYLASLETWRCAALPAMLETGHPWVGDDVLAGALEDALAALEPDETWGDRHRLTLAHPLARIPGLEPMFTAADRPLGGDEQTVAATGADRVAGPAAAVIASVRMVWDLADPHACTPVVPTGVSGNPASPHWADQTEAYTTGETPPADSGGVLTIEPSGYHHAHA